MNIKAAIMIVIDFVTKANVFPLCFISHAGSFSRINLVLSVEKY